jgi:hypothetical protein
LSESAIVFGFDPRRPRAAQSAAAPPDALFAKLGEILKREPEFDELLADEDAL